MSQNKTNNFSSLLYHKPHIPSCMKFLIILSMHSLYIYPKIHTNDNFQRIIIEHNYIPQQEPITNHLSNAEIMNTPLFNTFRLIFIVLSDIPQIKNFLSNLSTDRNEFNEKIKNIINNNMQFFNLNQTLIDIIPDCFGDEPDYNKWGFIDILFTFIDSINYSKRNTNIIYKFDTKKKIHDFFDDLISIDYKITDPNQDGCKKANGGIYPFNFFNKQIKFNVNISGDNNKNCVILKYPMYMFIEIVTEFKDFIQDFKNNMGNKFNNIMFNDKEYVISGIVSYSFLNGKVMYLRFINNMVVIRDGKDKKTMSFRRFSEYSNITDCRNAVFILRKKQNYVFNY